MYFNSKGKEEVSYDAIVIGSGISGGWAAKELSEKGLNTLVLERGRDIKHGDYPTAMLDPWEVPNRGKLTEAEWADYPVHRRTGYTLTQYTKHHWFKDSDHPYNEVKPFDWIRAYHVGGRSLLWGRHSYRWSELDFDANAKDGVAIDWPIRYADIAPWYDYVEEFAGISGEKLGLAHFPDGKFQPPMELNCIEKYTKEKIAKAYNDRVVTVGRMAHITKPGGHKGRGTCQYRNRCMRGCPYGAYFSSNASTLPAAAATGNMTLRPHSIVHSIIFDDKTQKATGVQVIDQLTKETHEYYAKIIFLNASALNSAGILMHSKSARFPDGMGNDSGQLGHNIMDHHFQLGASAKHEGFQDQYYKGRRPTGTYIPRFRNISKETRQKDFLRGYGYQGGGGRESWWRPAEAAKFGAAYKEELVAPGQWTMSLHGFGECLPYYDNKMSLNYEKLDKWGLPTLDLDVEWKENELAMRKDMKQQAAEMLEAAGFKNVNPWENRCKPGLGIHEMGTARMGRDPKTSVLNKWNQIHAVKNVFVTDGACMTSSANQNPSLTYMALTARAANYAAEALKKNEI